MPLGICLVDLSEAILRKTAYRAHPIVGNILKRSARLNPTIGISHFGVVDIAARAFIFVHSGTSFLTVITATDCTTRVPDFIYSGILATYPFIYFKGGDMSEITNNTSIEPVQGQEQQSIIQRIGLTGMSFVGLIAGAILGIILNVAGASGNQVYEVVINGFFYVIGRGFIRLMQMLVVPLVFTSIVCGAAAMGSGTLLGRVGGLTVLLYLFTTLIAVTLGLGIGMLINPGLGLDLGSITQGEVPEVEATTIADTFLNMIPSNVVDAMASGTMLQIILFALILGYVIGVLGEKVETVDRVFKQFNDIMMRMVQLVLSIAPIGVFCLLTYTFANLGLSALLPLAKFVGGTYIGLFIQLIVTYGILLVLIAKVNPARFLRKMLPVMGFAFSTSSSNATIPLNVETLEKRIGVSPKITGFTIPLGATINMDGTAIMQGVAVVFAAQAFNIDLGFAGYLTVILTATLASIGTAGVPGVGTIMLTMVFESVGLPVEGVSMIMGVDRLVDMGRTAVNVTGDEVVTTCVAKLN